MNRRDARLPLYHCRRAADRTGNGQECDPAKWDSKTGRAAGSKAEARTLNAYLDSTQNKIYELQRQLGDAGETVTVETIRNKFTGKDEKAERWLRSLKTIMKRWKTW